MTQLFTDKEMRCKQRHDLYPYHYSKSLLNAKNQLLGTMRRFVQIAELGKLNTREELRTVEKANVPYCKRVAGLHASSMYHHQTTRLSPKGMTVSKRSFVQNPELCITTTFQRFPRASKKLSTLDQIYSWPDLNPTSTLKSLTYLNPAVPINEQTTLCNIPYIMSPCNAYAL